MLERRIVQSCSHDVYLLVCALITAVKRDRDTTETRPMNRLPHVFLPLGVTHHPASVTPDCHHSVLYSRIHT
jgi:hypothetical protein